MTASIRLTSTVRRTKRGTLSLTFQTEGTNIDSAVFAIEVLPKSADSEAPNYRFSHVCSPAELVEFPAQEPGDSCYFRVSEIELILDTDKIVDAIIQHMQEDIGRLTAEYNELETAESYTTTVDL